MLIFDRKEFVAGVQVIKEQWTETRTVIGDDGQPKQVEGVVSKAYILKPGDKGKEFQFKDEDDVLRRYPLLFKKKK